MKRGEWLCIECNCPSGWSRRCPAHRKAREREMERRWEKTPRARARARRFHAEPRWKIYLARWKEQHQELQAGYDLKADAKSKARYALVQHPCQTTACHGTFSKRGKAGRRKFCDECRIFYGYIKRRDLAA